MFLHCPQPSGVMARGNSPLISYARSPAAQLLSCKACQVTREHREHRVIRRRGHNNWSVTTTALDSTLSALLATLLSPPLHSWPCLRPPAAGIPCSASLHHFLKVTHGCLQGTPLPTCHHCSLFILERSHKRSLEIHLPIPFCSCRWALTNTW